MALEKNLPFPVPLPLKKLLGPSFLILALGLGSGEVILWPYLSANYGLGIAWGALIGITFQFFINMEIERYALAKGESVFVGIHQLFRWAPAWFIVSTFIGFGLPGIIAASASAAAYLFGIEDFRWLAAFFLLLIGLILSSGKTVYGVMEKITTTVIILGVPIIFIIATLLASLTDWVALGQGLVGVGADYLFLPPGISLAVFLGAFAYSGAGGNLNLTQSIYIKEKNYGMGVYAQKISGLFKSIGQQQELKLTGSNFALTEKNLRHFHQWWRLVNLEHGLVFWLIGLISISMLMLLAFATTSGLPDNSNGIAFVINEAVTIGSRFGSWLGSLFLVLVAVMLFQTQLGVMDSISRIMAENWALLKIGQARTIAVNLSKIYFSFLWLLISFGLVLFWFDVSEPKTLIVLGAVINAIAMFVHIGLVNWTNYKLLPKVIQPRLWRKIIIGLAFVFFGIFSTIVIADTITKFVS